VGVDGMVAAYRRTHSPSSLAWSEGWQPLDTKSAFVIVSILTVA